MRLPSARCLLLLCPLGVPPAPQLPCASEARCLDGRCANACPLGTSPVATAAPDPYRLVSAWPNIVA